MVESRTAKSPAAAPPNHALAITAPKNRNRNGYGNKGCSSSVKPKASPTESRVKPMLRRKLRTTDPLNALCVIACETLSTKNRDDHSARGDQNTSSDHGKAG